MASFAIKLVDHTGSSDKFGQFMANHLQDLFIQVFGGTTDQATVGWGAGTALDSVVLHFVTDVPGSYLARKLPGKPIRPDAGGHTRSPAGVTGSEFYKFVVFQGERIAFHHKDIYAKFAFHEALHNQWPGRQDMHEDFGGFGLASASPESQALNERNKELMRKGLAIKNVQLQ